MNAKEKLITSLFDLLTIKNFLDINVSEVCKIAKVHRTTFYAYYDNLVELLVDSKDYALKKFKDENMIKSDDLDYLSMEVLVPYLSFIKKYPNFYKAYLYNANVLNARSDFEKIYQNYFLKDALRRKDVDQNDEWLIRKITEFFMNGINGLIISWLKDECNDSPEDIAKVIVKIRNLNS